MKTYEDILFMVQEVLTKKGDFETVNLIEDAIGEMVMEQYLATHPTKEEHHNGWLEDALNEEEKEWEMQQAYLAECEEEVENEYTGRPHNETTGFWIELTFGDYDFAYVSRKSDGSLEYHGFHNK